MTRQELLEQASQKINKVLREKTCGWYFTSPGKRALVWFKCYEVQKLYAQKDIGYSISRTDARLALLGFGINLDEMLAKAGLT